MLSRISLCSRLIGVAATIPLVQMSVVAKSSIQIAQTAKTLVVSISEPNSQGSGVILQHQGDIYTVLTAAHVVKNKVSYTVTTPDDRSYEAIGNSIRSAPGSLDLAVLKFKSTAKYPIAKLGNCHLLKSGIELYVAGFPATDSAITTSILVVREGKVSANSNKTFDKGYSLIYSNDTLPGMSGGAVLNSNGELVAIHGEGDRDDDGRKNGFNLGIPIDRFAMVASAMGVELGERVAPIAQNTTPRADDYFASGVQKSKQGDDRGALADYNRAIELNANYAVAYNNRGNLKYNKLQDVPGALADYDRAIALDPNSARAYYNRGVLKKNKLQDFAGALTDYDRAIAIDPSSARAYYNRGALKKDNFLDDRGALADYDRAIALDPSYALAYANRGLLKYHKLNQRSGGIADMQQAAKLYQQQGSIQNYQKAIGHLHKWQQTSGN